MVSLRKFLHKEDADSSRFVAPLLEGIASTAIESDAEDLRAFQKAIRKLIENVVRSGSQPQDVAEAIEQAIRLLETYNNRVHAVAQSHQNELRAMLSLMIETLAFLSASSKTSVEQLSSIEKSLESVSDLNELKMVRGKVTACLTLVRTESTRLKLQSEKKIKNLQGAVLRASTQILPYVAATAPDSVTGLAGPDAVRALISKSVEKGNPVDLAIFVLEQIADLNRTVGRKVADDVMAASAQMMGNELAEFGPMFRWNGPSLILAIEKSADTLDAVRSRIKQLSRERMECTVEVEHQAKRFPVFFSWAMEHVREKESPETVLRKLDAFVSDRTNGAGLEHKS